MAQITWRNVEAPSFRDSMDGFRIAADQLNGAFDSARNALNGFDKSQNDEVNKAFALRLAAYSDPEKLQAALADGSLHNGLDSRRLSLDSINAAPGRIRSLLENKDLSGDIKDEEADRIFKTENRNALRELAPFQAQDNLLRSAGRIREADAIWQTAEAKGALSKLTDPSKITELLSGAIRLGSERQNFDITGTRFNDEQTDRNEMRQAVVGAQELIRNSGAVDGSDLLAYINTHHDVLASKYGAYGLELVRQKAMSDPTIKPFDYDWSGVGGAGGSAFDAAAINASPDNASAIIEAAKQLGTSPEDLATVISYETGGKFDPDIVGGKNNNHVGLIQFGQEERAKYGVKPGMGFKAQMGAVVNFLKDRGFKPGMDINDLYSTINAGQPGRYNASDGNGTVRTHVAKMLTQHRQGALNFLNAAATATNTDIKSDMTGDPATLAARNFAELWQDKTPAKTIAMKLTSKDGPFVGESPAMVTSLIQDIVQRGKGRINPAMAAEIASQAIDGERSALNPGTWKYNPFASGRKASLNEEFIDEQIKLVSNPEYLRKATLATEARANTMASTDAARQAAARSNAGVSAKLNYASRLGRNNPATAQLNQAGAAVEQFQNAVGNGVNASARGGPSEPPAQQPVARPKPTPAPAPKKAAPKGVDPVQAVAKINQKLAAARDAAREVQKIDSGFTPILKSASINGRFNKAVNATVNEAIESGLPQFRPKPNEHISTTRERVKKALGLF